MKRLTGYAATMRTVGGLVGGFAGSALIAGVAIASSALLRSVFTDGVQSVFVTLLFLLTFFGASVLSSLVAFTIMSKTDNERFFYLGPAIKRMLIVNVAIFVLLLPAYFIGGAFDSFFIPVTSVVHFIASALFGYLIFELEARVDKRPFFSVFSTLVGGLIGAIFVMLLFTFAGSGKILVFLVPMIPTIMWFNISLFSALLEILYGFTYSSFGVDLFALSVYDRSAYKADVSLHEQIAREEDEAAKHMK